MLTVSAISRIFNLLFFNTRSWILATLSSVVADFGAAECDSLNTILRSCWKSFKYFFYVEELTHTGAKQVFDFITRFPFQKQELNHRRILFFFHVPKILRHVTFFMYSLTTTRSGTMSPNIVWMYLLICNWKIFLEEQCIFWIKTQVNTAHWWLDRLYICRRFERSQYCSINWFY